MKCAIIFGKNHSEAVYLGKKRQKSELETKKTELEPSEAKFWVKMQIIKIKPSRESSHSKSCVLVHSWIISIHKPT